MAFSKTSFCNLGLTEAELLAIKTAALADITTGKTITSISAPGLSTTSQVYASAHELLAAAVYALQCLDPDTYGRPPVDRVVGTFV